ncbi:conserved unknown protein [Ectocarpus siliculosus]|uniref:Methyltransferase small domain-containing protein n=1 Tax=Ectocarpus siliculosus TaxID=2880 RepID=D7FP93_ECTSI|nr:conserved unknown protein [Ectocarpus siliculosus]|eukprot:CBJ30354.1 conserved unknown protein [Ectocarpus siliculosus]
MPSTSAMEKICEDGTPAERLVLSEVHVGSSGLHEEAEVVSRYAYLTPTSDDNEDSGSDSGSDSEEQTRPRVARHRKRPRHEVAQRCCRPSHEVLTIVHKMATTLGLVGQQVWSASFLLGDFVLTHNELFVGMQVLDLGAGPGVVGLIAARVARRCYLTDYHDEVLKLLDRNVEANRHLFALEPSATHDDDAAAPRAAGGGDSDVQVESGTLCSGVRSSDGGRARSGDCVAAVRKLDWFTFSKEQDSLDVTTCDSLEEDQAQSPAFPSEADCAGMGDVQNNTNDDRTTGTGTCGPFSWRKGELDGLSLISDSKRGGPVIVAADVIYDEGLTDALFQALTLLMPVPSLRARGLGKEDRNCDSKVSSTADNATKPLPHQTTPSTTPTPSCEDSAVTYVPVSKPVDDHDCHPLGTNAVLYLALEKRFNFSVAELSVAATGYSALLRNVVDVTENDGVGTGVDGCTQQGLKSAKKAFEGRRLPLSFQQCFRYERSNAMELWEIRRRPVSSEISK